MSQVEGILPTPCTSRIIA